MELIPRRRLKKWINRKGFRIRKILILKWIVLGSVVTWAYKSKFFSSLVTIRYTKPVDTLADLDSSGLPFLLTKGSGHAQMFGDDPRPAMKRIYRRRIVFEYTPESARKFLHK